MNINSVISHAIYYGGIIMHVAGTLALMLLVGVLPWMPGWASILLTLLIVVLTMANVVVLYKWFHFKKQQTRNFTVCPVNNNSK